MLSSFRRLVGIVVLCLCVLWFYFFIFFLSLWQYCISVVHKHETLNYKVPATPFCFHTK
jgi:hypothetical protein